MRARNVLCTLGIGALAMGVSAYAAPREAQSGKSPRTESSRLIAGQGGELRSGLESGSVANGTGVRVRLKAARTIPAGGVPAGNDILIAGGPTKVVIEAFYGGWGLAQGLQTYQLTIDPASFSSGGGGPLTGSTGVACATNADCHAAFGVVGTPGDLKCNDFNPGSCNNVYQETARPDFNGAIPAQNWEISACNQAGYTCGSTKVANAATTDAGTELYGMSAVLDVPANASGTYTLTFDEPGLIGTYLQVADGSLLVISKITHASVIIPTGSCCFNLGLPNAGCDTDVTQATCQATHPGTVIFRPGQPCPDGNPANDCAACSQAGSTSDPACNDNDACTVDRCLPDLSACTHVETPAIGPDDCCNPANNVRTNRNDGDPCTDDICSAGGNRGTAQNPASPDGASCDDGNPCFGFDQCTGGICAGTNINGAACTVDADCQAGGTPGAVCDGGTCLCALNPSVTIVLTHDDPDPSKDNACYLDSEKVTATIHIGPAANTLVGVQFAITYDTNCLTFNSIQPAGPWTQVLMVRTGGQCAGGIHDGQSCATNCAPGGGTCVPAGTIFYAAGIPLGGQGTQGNSDAAVLSFTKKVGCVSCEICFSDNNPLHTRFSDDTGQMVGADTSCSDEIRTKSPIDLDTPDTIKVNKGCDSNVATVTWDEPTAGFGCNEGELVCSGVHLESDTQWDQNHVLHGGVFPGGNSNFCCTATNDCGNTVQECWTVTVNDETSLEVEVQLSPTMDTKPGGGIIRCIKFEVFNNCVQAPLVFDEDLLFGGLLQLVGHFNGHIKIPAAVQPACITARDQKHTLRSCYTFGEGDCDSNGVLHATFKQDPFFGGNWLIGGNLDGWKKDNPNASHDVIDILDFGTLVAEWLKTYDSNGDQVADGNTPCGVFLGNHADINGDGVVDTLDFSFVAMNFLDNSKDCCCPGSASLGNSVGRTEITVRELREQGMNDLTVADLNADGKVDMADMAALMQGVRPNLKANDGSKDGSRSINRK